MGEKRERERRDRRDVTPRTALAEIRLYGNMYVSSQTNTVQVSGQAQIALGPIG